MTIKIGINGYGRIGRNMLRALYEGDKRAELEIVAVNDLGDTNTNAHLTRRDSAHGRFPGTIEVDGDYMVVNGDRIRVCAERDPAKLPGAEMMTFFAPASRCLEAASRVRKNPVDSKTISTPSSPQGSFAGSRSAHTRIRSPLTTM